MRPGHPLSGYADKLLAAFAQPVAASKSAIIHQKPDMIEPLSERELEVLKLLRSELTAQKLPTTYHFLPHPHQKHFQHNLGNDCRAAIRRADARAFSWPDYTPPRQVSQLPAGAFCFSPAIHLNHIML